MASRLSRLLPPPWATALGLCIVFALLGVSFEEPPHRLSHRRLVNQEGMPIRVWVYTPDPPRYPRAPAAIVCQPFNNPHEFARVLALELVEEGFVVLGFDWHGRTPEENRRGAASATLDVLGLDVRAAVAHLASLPEVDPRRIAIAGHSVGGTMALEAGVAMPELIAVASIGMPGYATQEEPSNVLWVLGLYDEFRRLWPMRESFQSSIETSAAENTTIGDFSRGTARRLAISPTADHFTELMDSGVQREVRDWFRHAAGLPETTRPLSMELRSLLLFLGWVSGLVGALLLMRRVVAVRKSAVRAAPALALVAVFALSRPIGAPFLLACDALWGWLLFGFVAGYFCTRESAALRRGAGHAVRFSLVLWASLLLTLVLNNVSSYLVEPRYLLQLPEFAIRHALDGLYSYLLVFPRPLLFSVYSPEGISPRAWVYGLLILELVRPAALLELAARLGRSQRRASAERRPSAVSAVLLVLLLGVLGAVCWLRFQQGYLTAESLRAALDYIGHFGLPPILLFAVLWHLSGRPARERRTSSAG